MSTRLQLLIDVRELHELRRVARQNRLTLSEWARRALRAAARSASTGDPGRKLQAVRAAARHAFPSADIGQMLAEIERGYGAGDHG